MAVNQTAQVEKFYQKVNGRSVPEERQTYYRKCLEKWLDIKQQGKSVSALLSDKEVKNIAIYGTGSIGKLLVNELTGHNKIEYFIVTSKKFDLFMGYSVYDCNDELPEASDSLSLIVIPGYEMEEIEKIIGNKFWKVYSLEDIFE